MNISLFLSGSLRTQIMVGRPDIPIIYEFYVISWARLGIV